MKYPYLPSKKNITFKCGFAIEVTCGFYNRRNFYTRRNSPPNTGSREITFTVPLRRGEGGGADETLIG